MSITIGHSAYSGCNAFKVVPSKAAAVRELRRRGLTRDAARQAVQTVAAKDWGYLIVSPDNYRLIEVNNRPDIQFRR